MKRSISQVEDNKTPAFKWDIELSEVSMFYHLFRDYTVTDEQKKLVEKTIDEILNPKDVCIVFNSSMSLSEAAKRKEAVAILIVLLLYTASITDIVCIHNTRESADDFMAVVKDFVARFKRGEIIQYSVLSIMTEEKHITIPLIKGIERRVWFYSVDEIDEVTCMPPPALYLMQSIVVGADSVRKHLVVDGASLAVVEIITKTTIGKLINNKK